MKILVLTPAVPFPPVGGGKTRTYQLIRALAATHAVTVIGFIYPPFPDQEQTYTLPFPAEVVSVPWEEPLLYRQMADEDPDVAAAAEARLANDPAEPWLCSWVESDAMRSAIRTVVASGVDVIVLETTIMARFLDELPPATPKVLDLHDVYARMTERAIEQKPEAAKPAAIEEAARTLAFERRAAAKCRAVTTCSADEAEAARTMLQAPAVKVIPNGVDTSYFKPVSDSPASTQVLFTGTLSYAPNIKAVEWFVADIWPRVHSRQPAATFHIVGADPPASVTNLASESVIVHGSVPDMRPFYENAAVVVVPLRQGGGTRLKILEAGACQKAIVSTTLGAEGLNFSPGRDLVIADTAEGFAEVVERLLADSAERARLGMNARNTSLQYDWSGIGRQFAEMIDLLPRG